METRTKMGRGTAIVSTLLAGIILLAGSTLASTAGAQSGQSDARWRPWLGCWQPVSGLDELSRGSSDPMLCVVPVSGSSSVELVSVDSGRTIARERITANGERMTSEVGGCKGWESAKWSPDGERLYLGSDFNCGGGLHRASTGIFAVAPGGTWLNVQGVSARDGGGVRVIRYRSASPPDDLRDELARVTAERELALSTARTAAAGEVTDADIIEASHAVDPAVVEAWLIERRQRFSVDADRLVKLADAGVPSRVVDAMVALSYPEKFAIAGSDGIDMPSADAALESDENGRRTTHSLMMYPYSFGYGFGYSPFDYYYSPYGYSPYGYGYGYGWYPGGGPVVIIQNPGSVTAPEHGRVVNGHGYVRGRRSSDSDNSGSSDRGSISRRARDSSPSPSTGASSAPARSGQQSTGRTAKPRNP